MDVEPGQRDLEGCGGGSKAGNPKSGGRLGGRKSWEFGREFIGPTWSNITIWLFYGIIKWVYYSIFYNMGTMWGPPVMFVGLDSPQ